MAGRRSSGNWIVSLCTLVALAGLGGVACSPVDPELESDLDSKIGGPLFAGQKTYKKTIASDTDDFEVLGSCDRRFSKLEISCGSGASFVDVKTVARPGHEVDCNDGKFTLVLSPTYLQFTGAGTPEHPEDKSCLVRGVSFFGKSPSSELTVSLAISLNVAITAPTAEQSINLDNQSSFAVTGTCSSRNRDVVLTTEPASSTVTATCTNGTWAASLDLQVLADGPITVVASHSNLRTDVVTTQATWVKDTLPPASPISLTLSSPSSSPGFDTTPTIRVGGVSSGDTALLFTDSACTTNVGSAVSSSSFVDVTTSALANGSYQFYARTTDASGNSSACSSATVAYQLLALPTVQFSVAAQTALESAGTVAAQVDISNAYPDVVTIPYTVSGTATGSGTDHNLANGTLTIAAGASSALVTFAVNDDSIDEAAETVIVTLGTPSNAALGTNTLQTISITDNDAAPTLSVTDATVNEGTGTAVFTVALSAVSGQVVAFDWTTADATATAGSDYAAGSAAGVTIAAGQTSATLTVVITQDVRDEADETFNVNLSNGVNATFADNSGLGQINDDDNQPSLSISGGTVAEGAGSATFTVSLSAQSGRAVTFDWATSNGTAVSGSDYTAGSETGVTINAGQTSVTFTVAVTSDALYEASESFTVGLANAGNATIASATATGTITDDDSAPSVEFSQAAQGVGEADGAITVQVALSAASGQAMTVPYTVTGTATGSGTDHDLASGTFSIAAGASSTSVTFTINNDAIYEPTAETVIVTLGSPSNATLGTQTVHTVTITDNDASPSLSISDEPVNESAAPTTVSFVVTANALSSVQTTVNWATAPIGGQATSDVDFTSASGTTTIPAGSLTATITVPILQDALDEFDEQFKVVLSGAVNATIGDNLGVATIADDDATPTVTFTSASQSKGESVAGAVTVTVQLSAASGKTVTVPYTVSGTAANPADHDAVAGNFVIAAGATTASMSITLADDSIDEAVETIILTMGSVVNATAGAQTTHTVSAIDNEAPPELSIADVNPQEGDGTISLTVTLSPASGQNVTFDWSTMDVTATGGNDFTAVAPTSVTIAAGATSAVVNVAITNDSLYETNETFWVTLNNQVNANFADTTAVVTILDNDAAPTVSFTAAAPTVAENVGTVTVSVTQSTASGMTTSIPFTVSGSATGGGTDHNLSNGTITIPAGQTSASTTFTVTDDGSTESTETVILTMGSVSGATASAPTTSTISITDDDGPFTVTLDAAYSNGANWNDYVKNDGADVYHAGNIACGGTETGTYFAGCIHGGEIKKVIVTGYSSCSNLTAADDLAAFDWVCAVDTGTATFYSSGLKAGKGLRDLISTGGVWNANRVRIYSGATEIANSVSSTTWWSNAIAPLPASSGVVTTLSTPGKIYYVSSANQNVGGYFLTADNIAIVTLGTNTITYDGPVTTCNSSSGTTTSPTIACLLFGATRKFMWIEASILGSGFTNPVHAAVFAKAWTYSRFHRSTISATSTASSTINAFELRDSNSNYLQDLDIHMVSFGMNMINSDNNIVRTLRVADIYKSSTYDGGVYIASGSDGNRLYDVRVVNNRSTSGNAYGIYVGGSSNRIIGAVISNINGSLDSSGIQLGSGASSNIISQVVVSNTKDTGLKLAGTNSNNIFTHVTTGNNTYNGLYWTGTNITNNYFNSLVILNTQKGIEYATNVTGSNNSYVNIASNNNSVSAVDANTLSQVSTFSGYMITQGSCGGNGTNLTASCNNGSSPVAASLSTALVGAVSSDSANASPAGTSTYATITTLAKWLNFDSFFRTWGINQASNVIGASGTANLMGYCASGATCRIWDWRAKSGNTVHDRSYNGSSVNASFAAGGSCGIAPLSGSEVSTANSITFMKYAVEISFDNVGNDNGLCESNEECIYAPNIGAYQGEGSYTSGGYCTTSGTVSGAKIYKYATTGI